MKNTTGINLFEPYRIRNLELRNRFVRSATWDNTADNSGAVTDNSIALFQKLGGGGVGLIVTGFAFIAPDGQALSHQYGIHNDRMIPGLHKLVRAAHGGGAKIALQIVHAGINSAYLQQAGIVARAVSLKPDATTPHKEMTDEEIETIIAQFASAARRAREAGFDAIQIHGAHGYLLSQFLSPLYNTRTDCWGGSNQNRGRFHRELVKQIRQVIGNDFPLLIKFGILDDSKGGLTLHDGLKTAQRMVDQGIDAVEVSAGVGKIPVATGKNPPEVVPYRERAAALKRAITVPVMVVSGIRKLETAQNIVDGGDADLISLSRPLIKEPDLIARWQRGDTRSSDCVSCFRCHSKDNEPVQCRKKDI